jgi:hypothetical protein
MAWKMLGCEAFSRSSAVTVVVGVGWVKPRELMREPVTTTSVMVVSSLAAACCGLLCVGHRPPGQQRQRRRRAGVDTAIYLEQNSCPRAEKTIPLAPGWEAPTAMHYFSFIQRFRAALFIPSQAFGLIFNASQ